MPPCVGSLSSMDVFVVICTVVTDDWVGNQDEAVYFWVGTHAPIDLQEHGAKVGKGLVRGDGSWLMMHSTSHNVSSHHLE